MTKEEFIEKLSQVDWYYQYIESAAGHKIGMNLYFEVYVATQSNEEFKALFDKERAKFFPE